MSRPVVIAGGGTAGHVVPALAVGQALRARGREVLFVGSRRGLEARLIPEAGFEVVLLPGRGIVRRVSLEAAGAAAAVGAACAEAVALLLRRRPAVVLAVGGYASVPCAVAAGVLRIPLLVAEQNAVPGAANRVASRWAKASAVAFEGTALPRAVVTGNPIRAEVAAVSRAPADRNRARATLDIPEGRRLVAVTGGSLGARRINEAVIDVARRWQGREDLFIHHAIGARDWPELRDHLPTGPHYRAVEYESRIPTLLSAADVWVGRAGGTTMAELTAVGVPSILVPLPGAPGDHQTAGARRLEAAGGAVVVADPDMNGDRLGTELAALLAEPARLEAMGAAAAGRGHRDAADRVADLVDAYASEGAHG